MALTTAQLKALPYKKTAHSSGITSLDYKRQYAQHGERVRWWKAIRTKKNTVGRDGIKYIEQNLADSVRVMFYGDGLEIEDPDGMKIRIGDASHAGIPDEIEIGNYDRTLYPGRERITSEVISPSGNTTDNLSRLFVTSIDMVVTVQGVILDALAYELYGRAIRWRGTPPTGEVTVRYSFCPQYEFRGEGDKQAFIGSDGKKLPQRVPMHLVPAKEERDS